VGATSNGSLTFDVTGTPIKTPDTGTANGGLSFNGSGTPVKSALTGEFSGQQTFLFNASGTSTANTSTSNGGQEFTSSSFSVKIPIIAGAVETIFRCSVAATKLPITASCAAHRRMPDGTYRGSSGSGGGKMGGALGSMRC
jgi:hypothetical protein